MKNRPWRAQGDALPIIMLTARGDEIDRIVGLELGADDYLPKPFNPRELLARVQAMLRRQAMLGARPSAAVSGTARFGDFELDLAAQTLRRAGAPVELTSGEFALLRAFVQHAGRPLSRERLIELTRGRDHDASDRSIAARLLAGVSHDLRTPLTKIRFALEYVGPHCEPDMRALMERNIAAADRIVDQFVDFAREGSDEPAQPESLNALVTEVVGRFDPVREPIALELGELPPLPLRRTAVQRLIANLLRNALEYARRDVAVRTSAAGGRVTLSVLDRGPGIPAADLERLKQPFTRLEAARTGAGGSGLGLAIVERIARQHGARFELLPRDGGGLEARVRFG